MEQLKNMEGKDARAQANEIWKMLDEMAISDPEGYKNFINKQLSEGKKSLEPPRPNMCISTFTKIPEDLGLYINFFAWDRLPAPKTDSEPIPIYGGHLYKGKDKQGIYNIVCVALSPKVLEEFGLHCNKEEEQQMLVNLTFDFLENTHNMKIVRNYTVLPNSVLYKGSLQYAISTLTQKVEKDPLNKEVFSGIADNDVDSLLDKLPHLVHASEQPDGYILDDRPASLNENDDLIIPSEMPNKTTASPLVQEMSAQKSLPEPEYHFECLGNKLVLKIYIPGVKSMAECDVDFTERDLHLLVPAEYELQVEFPKPINETKTKAKFIKNQSTLIVTSEILSD